MSSESQQPSLRVLVVNDNVDTATTLNDLLRRLGCNTAVAFCGAEGLRLSALFQPHISFIDLNLPDLDGCQVARKIREDDPRPQTLICFTGAVERLTDGQAAVFDIVATKPMERDRLVEIVEDCRSQLPPDVIAPAWWRIGSPASP
jgi:CheY-like chemotaxis protein